MALSSNLHLKFKNAKPFPFLHIKNFLPLKKANALKKALLSQTFEEKKSDLFFLFQTKDLLSASGEIKNFRDYLSSVEFIEKIEQLTGKKLKHGALDCAGHVYSDTCFLLPHDDQLEGRSIAFVYYLSTLKQSEGGALELFDKNSRVAKRIPATFNSFVIFEVSKKSMHQVSEVLVKKDRLSISGWFYDK